MRSTHVLVVDDDPEIRSVLAAILADEGYTVDVAKDGRHALESIDTRVPDIILADLFMPGMGGREFVRTLRDRGALIPIIVMTASRLVTSHEDGMDDAHILEKPFDLDDVLAVVSKASSAH